MDEAVELLDPVAHRAPDAREAAEVTFGQPSAPKVKRVANRLEWRIRCDDALDRERCLTVVAEAGRVLVVSPPGETAVLSPGQLGQLRTALVEAAKQAEG